MAGKSLRQHQPSLATISREQPEQGNVSLDPFPLLRKSWSSAFRKLAAPSRLPAFQCAATQSKLLSTCGV